MRGVIVLLTGLWVTTSAAAQDQPKLTTLYFGVKACLPCHEKESEAFASQEKLSHSESVFTSRLLEYNVWSKHDKHKDAAKALTNERSKQIAAIMGIKGDLTKEARCANCHGVYIDPAKEKDLIHEDTFSGDDRLASGVSCVACHGAKLEWVNEHAAPVPKKKWATRSRAEKESLGLRDLWNPVARAELCFSCHVGNVKENKFVTHEMYAAGHPPLPSIEIATFSDAMPAHWESLTQKAARARELGDKAKNGAAFLKTAYGIDANAMEMEQTRLVGVSSLISLQRSVQMMGEYATESLAGKADRSWPELAFYDCYACHHDLKSKSWRLERGYQGKPGRPTVRPWPFVFARFGDRLLEPPPSPLEPAVAKWNALFNDVPFGEAAKVAAEAKTIDGILAERIKQLAVKKFDRATADRAALDLVELAKKDVHDFDTARQFAWALRTIAIERQNEGTYGLVKPGENRLKGSLAAPFGVLEKSLQLRLPEGQVEIVPSILDSVFGQISAYDPREFRKTMGDVEKALRR